MSKPKIYLIDVTNRDGVQTSCRHGGFFSQAQAELIRVPQAAGTLVKLPVGEDSALLPSPWMRWW